MTHAALKDLLARVADARKNERHHNAAETTYWLNQWRDIATDLAAALSAMEGEASLRLALRRIADYEGDPLTPVRNSAKKSQIARNALEPMSQFDSFWEDAAAYEREADAFCYTAPPPQQAVVLADKLYALAKTREFYGRRVSLDEIYTHVAELRALATQPQQAGGGNSSEVADMDGFFQQINPTPSPGPQGGGEEVLALLSELARALPPISTEQTATQHMIQHNRRERALQIIGDFILRATPPAHQPGEVVRKALDLGLTYVRARSAPWSHTVQQKDEAAIRAAIAALAPKEAGHGR